MNSSSFNRTQMIQHLSPKDFFKHLGNCVQRELSENGDVCEVIVKTLPHYYMTVKFQRKTYQLAFKKSQITRLMNEEIFALDRTIWMILEQKGLKIPVTSGNYMKHVFPHGHRTVICTSK